MNHWTKIGLLLLFCGLALSVKSKLSSDHDFHVSVMKIHYNPESQSLEVAVKIFTNDLENTIERWGIPNLRIGTPQESRLTDTLIGAYLGQCLDFAVNGESMDFAYIGKEVGLDNECWCYLEIKGVGECRKLEVENRILMDLFEDQVNLVDIIVRGQKKSLALKQSLSKGTVSFD